MLEAAKVGAKIEWATDVVTVPLDELSVKVMPSIRRPNPFVVHAAAVTLPDTWSLADGVVLMPTRELVVSTVKIEVPALFCNWIAVVESDPGLTATPEVAV